MKRTPSHVIYTAVLPAYRQECWRLLAARYGAQLTSFAGDKHLEPSVRTALDPDLYRTVRNIGFLRGRVLIQLGGWGDAIRASTTVVDLNPRSATAWLLLVIRWCLRRRTLVWGHLHPQAGGESQTARLRRAMRRVSSGTILYGYASVEPARTECKSSPIWVAANSLYRASDISCDAQARRDLVIYVGRLEREKKVDLLVRAFADCLEARPDLRLAIVGQGADADRLRGLADSLGMSDRCDFVGRIFDPAQLRALYARAICSVSPGYAGLSLTQSIGFSVPVVVADNEAHSPEIELERTGAIRYFPSDSAPMLAEEILAIEAGSALRMEWSNYVRQTYSAECMSGGIIAALEATQQSLRADGWPTG